MKALLFSFLFSTSLFAQTLHLKDFNYPVPDIASQNLNKEELYSKMNHSLIRLKDSICSNRAHMWAYDFKRQNQIETPKIFLFYTAKSGRYPGVTWWYHVSPMVNENSRYWVMDAGYPDRLNKPAAIKDWLKVFTGEKSICKEIKPGDDDLVKLMFSAKTFPEVTRHGKYDCYYKLVPPGYWTPEAVAKNILGHDADGTPVRYVRDEINKSEVYSACLEAATSPFGWAFRSGKAACQRYIRTGFLKF